MMEARGMRGTFYVISGYLGHPGYLTAAQARSLEAAGHEIGGHTVGHRHLPTLSLDEARREICNDRATLMSYGLHPQSFAYPYGEASAELERLVEQCGYDSGRIVGPIAEVGRPAAETIPPVDPMATRTPRAVEISTSLQQIQDWVTAAEASEGWLQLVFHDLCEDGASCGRFSTPVSQFGALLDWLVERAGRGTVVKLEREVIGVDLRSQSFSLVSNPVMDPSLEGSEEVPECWQRAGFGTNTFSWTKTDDAHSGGSAQQVVITDYTSGARHLVPTLSTYAPPGLPGHRYEVSAWYKSSAAPRWTVYYRDRDGLWTSWAQGARLPASASWTQASFTTPPLPSAATAISFGLSLVSTGSLTVDDFSLLDRGAP